MGLEEGGDAPVGDPVPDLDAPVSGAADEVFAGVAPPEAGDVPGVMVGGHRAHEALGRVDVVHPDDGRGGPCHYGERERLHLTSLGLTEAGSYLDSRLWGGRTCR